MMQRLLEQDAQLSTSLRFAEQSSIVRTLAVILAHSGDSWFWLLGLGLAVGGSGLEAQGSGDGRWRGSDRGHRIVG